MTIATTDIHYEYGTGSVIDLIDDVGGVAGDRETMERPREPRLAALVAFRAHGGTG